MKVWMRVMIVLIFIAMVVVMNESYTFGSIEHELLVQAFYVLIVLTAFFEIRMLFPLVLAYVIVHSALDAMVHGSLPVPTLVQSLVQLFLAGVLYTIIKWRDMANDEKLRLINQMRQGHAHYKGHLVRGEPDLKTRMVSVNAAFAAIMEKPVSWFESKPLESVFEGFPTQWLNAFTGILSSGESVEFSMYIPLLEKHLRVSLYAPSFRQGAVIMQDITKYKKASKHIAYLSRHDDLTGLFNRGYFMEMLKTSINEGTRPLGLVHFDIDNLKILNNAFDASAGDEAIRLAAQTIEKHALSGMMLFRHGGDEFTALMEQANETDLIAFARKVELDFSSSAIRGVSMTLSSGLSIKDADDTDSENIMAEAEKDLYHRKAVHMNSSHIHLLQGLLELLTAKFEYENVHSKHVSQMSRRLGETLGLSEFEVDELTVAAMFHDIGKIAIPDRILGKPASLDDEEYTIIKDHATIGYKILRAADPYTRLSEYVLYHHERYDGMGYPEGLKGEAIPRISRIIAVVDAYEAMTSKRNYRNPLSKGKAVQELRAHAGTQFDPDITQVFIERVLNSKGA
ncbi:MAG: HD domain-containing phosphohydrolase [Bacillota bacterium]